FAFELSYLNSVCFLDSRWADENKAGTVPRRDVVPGTPSEAAIFSGDGRGSLTEEALRDHSGPDQADPHRQKVTSSVSLIATLSAGRCSPTRNCCSRGGICAL